MQNKSVNTLIHGVSPEEFKESILQEVRKELSKLSLSNSPNNQVDEYVTRKEAAKLLKVSLITISDWNKKGILNPYRLGNLIRYKKSELEQALIQINSKNKK